MDGKLPAAAGAFPVTVCAPPSTADEAAAGASDPFADCRLA